MQLLVQILEGMTTLSVKNRIKNEQDSIYDMEMVSFLMIMIYAAFQECVLNFLDPMIDEYAKKIYTIIYIRKIPTYNIMSKIIVLITLRTYFGTD